MVHSCPRECYTARRRRPPTLTSKHPPGCTRLRLAREPRRVAWYTVGTLMGAAWRDASG